MRPLIVLVAASFLVACATPERDGGQPLVLLLGEQHDAPGHQQLEADVVSALAARGQLAALAIEMAESGTDTRGLPPHASEDDARQRLAWDTRAWPWAPYAPAVMAAVRAGVPVLGANLPRSRMQAAMQDDGIERTVPRSVLDAQREAIREGHCRLLPEAQVPAMARVQLARDRAMAQTLAQAAAPGRTVVLIAGAGHADPALGVPLHLPRGLAARSEILPPQPSGRDHCEELRRSLPMRQP